MEIQPGEWLKSRNPSFFPLWASTRRGKALQVLVLAILLVILAGIVYVKFRPPPSPFTFPSGTIELRPNPMVELDFKTRAEVLELRRKAVQEHPEFLNIPYVPQPAIFDGIQDGKAWWGIDDIFSYGPGQKSIEGPSEESRFLVNPFLLVGLCEAHAYPTIESGQPKPAPAHPELKSLVWKGDRKTFEVTYEVGRFLRFLDRFRIPEREISLITYNAQDFGFEFLSLDTANAPEIKSGNTSGKPILLRQFIHLGRSCGYPGGGNNGSPEQKELNFQVSRLPAKARIALWRNEPPSVTAPADLTILLNLEEGPARLRRCPRCSWPAGTISSRRRQRDSRPSGGSGCLIPSPPGLLRLADRPPSPHPASWQALPPGYRCPSGRFSPPGGPGFLPLVFRRTGVEGDQLFLGHAFRFEIQIIPYFSNQIHALDPNRFQFSPPL